MSSKEVQEKMLEELSKISSYLAPKPAPPPPPPPTKKSFGDEFLEFLNKYGVVGLAIGFIIGGAAGKLVTALVNDIIMPVITFFIPGGEWEKATLAVGPIVFAIGDFVGVLIDFLVIALIVFILMKQLSKTKLK
jgi:large conductance mechanosensitive channel